MGTFPCCANSGSVNPMPNPSSSQKKIIENPFIKPENKSWHLTSPASLTRAISPPPSILRKIDHAPIIPSNETTNHELPRTAEIEAGEATVTDQPAFWRAKLQEFDRPHVTGIPKLSISKYVALYSDHVGNTSGSHFVIHQHDHPVAGTHYDLRLQCNPTSSISFAIMYGLPGDPNSLRLNRNATETRVHCLWNHLIETASLTTGSMLIWDTGFYEVLPFKEEPSKHRDSDSDISQYEDASEQILTEQHKLHQAFSQRKMRLRLHGTRLPPWYTISLRLTTENNRLEQPPPPSRKRKRDASKIARKLSRRSTSSSSASDTDTSADMGPFGGGTLKRSLSSLTRHETPPPRNSKSVEPLPSSGADPGGSDHEAEDQEAIRKTNAYPGAINDIGSIHQRKWFLSMDRLASGFVPTKDLNGNRKWTRKAVNDGRLRGFEKFQVLGRDVERSVVTGRLASEILDDEHVVGFVPRGLWRGVTE